ncbi:MAG: endonuclease/exonuclease/phosphatase family protein [Oscillospiraceae bacterium]|nr:endonuclease/exonuclease/phosphatase family protein [Oscillospiraceae bacterium]
MKILTLNTHSLLEENYQQQLDQFIEGILREMPDIIALQEVNQSAFGEEIDPEMLEGQYPVPGCMRILQDNHAAQVAYRLRQAGVECSWAWIPIKLGYGKFDEGVAILSLGRKIRCVDQFPISKSKDYDNWRTRGVLGVQVEGLEDWFYTVHMGWWDDQLERFLDQWKKLNCCLASRRMCGPVWLLGDFNAPDDRRGEGYDAVAASGWVDTYRTAEKRGSGITVPGLIDGWAHKNKSNLRLDYIWCSRNIPIAYSKTIFDGQNGPMVSDHYGVLIETKA